MGGILPPKPHGTGVLGAGGGDNGKYFPNLYLKKRLHNKFQLTSTKIRGISLKGGGDLPLKPPRNEIIFEIFEIKLKYQVSAS